MAGLLVAASAGSVDGVARAASVVAVAIAVASLAWQVIAWRRSGARVRVTLRWSNQFEDDEEDAQILTAHNDGRARARSSSPPQMPISSTPASAHSTRTDRHGRRPGRSPARPARSSTRASSACPGRARRPASRSRPGSPEHAHGRWTRTRICGRTTKIAPAPRSIEPGSETSRVPHASQAKPEHANRLLVPVVDDRACFRPRKDRGVLAGRPSPAHQ
jgi:hypothetical protein